VGFRPRGLKWLSLSFQLSTVWTPYEASACTACGLLWTEINKDTLLGKLRDLGNDEMKKQFGLDDSS
jgi:hypothetical protein